MRLFNNELSVIHIRLGDQSFGLRRLRECAPHAVVKETRFEINERLHRDRIAARPIAEGIRNETPRFIAPFLRSRRLCRSVVSIGVGFVPNVHRRHVGRRCEGRPQHFDGEFALPEKTGGLLGCDGARNLHRRDIRCLDVRGRRQCFARQRLFGQRLKVVELLDRSPNEDDREDQGARKNAEEEKPPCERTCEGNRLSSRNGSGHIGIVTKRGKRTMSA